MSLDAIDIRHLANYHTYCMLIGSIPQSSRSYRTNLYKGGKQMPHNNSIRPGTLQSLLTEAGRLESEQVEVVKLLPYDDELQRLDKLQRVILQLKIQIALLRKP